jgi:hypothetical protein
MKIDERVDTVEFKFTAVPADEARVRELLSAHPSTTRDVFFYDTKSLAVNGRGVVLRERGDESTVKLRPAGPEVAYAAQAKLKKVKVEFDVVADAWVLAAKRNHTIDDGKTFSDEQQELIDGFTPGVPPLKSLEKLGPIHTIAWEIDGLLDSGFTLDAEEWFVNHLNFVELSVKADRDKAEAAQKAFRTFLTALVHDVDGERSRKTERVLKTLVDP